MQPLRQFFYYLVFFFILTPSFAADVLISNIQQTNENGIERYTFYFSGPTHSKVFSLPNPNRLVVDINNAKSQKNLSDLKFDQSLIKSARSSQFNKNTYRLVFDLTVPVKYNAYTFGPEGAEGYRLVVEVQPKNAQSSAAKPTVAAAANAPAQLPMMPTPTYVPKTPPANKPILAKTTNSKTQAKPAIAPTASWVATTPSKPAPLAPVVTQAAAVKNMPRNSRNIIIVIDPGHGGKDPGASGPRGYHEKNVVLAIARYLARDLNNEPGFKAVMTRSQDYYIPLRQRLDIARRDKGDMFVSIHADAFNDTSAYGASVYALSERGATSEAARWLAEQENHSELLGGGDLPDNDRLLRSVLIDLSQNHTIAVSLQIGSALLQQIGQFTALHHSRVEQAAFVVLKSPDIPSVLVETGYISNPREEQQLTNPQYQQMIAQSITRGIKSYFLRNPPRGTWLAQQKGDNIHYRVQKGDTLALLAERYHVSANDLLKYNQLRSPILKVGDTIKIPSAAYVNSSYPTIADM